MAPTHMHRYHGRSVDTGMAFTILFSVVASFIILSCFIWGFLVPYIRKKYLPPPPSRTRHNQRTLSNDSDITLTPWTARQYFRASDARMRSQVTVYDPRYQSPFPRVPSDPESIELEPYTPPRVFSANDVTTQGLFSPVRGRDSPYPDPRMQKSYTLPRIGPRPEREFAVQDRDYGDARDYILALPEPLRLRSQTHDGPLVASATLGRLPDLHGQSRSADKHLHPNKLFQQLSRKELYDSDCSSTSLKVKDAPNGKSDDSIDASDREHVVHNLSHQMTEGDFARGQPSHAQNSFGETALGTTSYQNEWDNQNPSLSAVHRLRTYRSLVGAPPPEPLFRAGTLTRPKTPVAKMRDLYDRSASGNKASARTVSRNDTVSTMFQTVADSSDHLSVQSSTTSLRKASPENYTVSSLSLLPTPLCLSRTRERRSASTPSKRNSIFKEDLPEACAMEGQPVQIIQGLVSENDNYADHEMVPLPSRARPTPLKLSDSSRLLPSQQSLGSSGSSPTVVGPTFVCRNPIPSMQASSIYSRNTQGISVARTPITPDFPKAHSYRPPFSSYIPSTIDDTTDSNQGTEANLVKRDASPMQVSTAKVDKWDLDMHGIDFDTSPSPSLKRVLSDLGPDCHSTHNVSHTDEPQRYSVISTEIALSEARLSSCVGPVRISDTTETAYTNHLKEDDGARHPNWV